MPHTSPSATPNLLVESVAPFWRDTPHDRVRDVSHQALQDGIAGIGAHGAIQAMLPHWQSHLADGADPKVLLDDIQALRELLGVIAEQLTPMASAE